MNRAFVAIASAVTMSLATLLLLCGAVAARPPKSKD